MQANQTVSLSNSPRHHDSESLLDSVPTLPANQLDLIALQAGELSAVTLTVAAGECIVIAGASGSGKSRLLRAIADLDPWPGSDDVAFATGSARLMLAGIDHYQYSGAEWRHRVAYVAAESQWWFDDVGSHFSIKPAVEQLQALGLNADILQQPVSRLSSGERQRLALLRALVQQPQVLLLDEPTASLDPGATLAVEHLLAAYRIRHQAAVIWVSHDAAQARRVGQRRFRLDRGFLEEQDNDPVMHQDQESGP